MSETVSDSSTVADSGDGSWRDRALERSLRAAKAKAISRSDRFIATAMELLQETGRTDFTVQELVDRSRTSLRSFYQYFSGKDELLLALLEETVAASTEEWREEIAGMTALDSLEVVVKKIHAGRQGADPWEGLNRALSSYHVSLAEEHSADYRRALEPLGRLIREIMNAGAQAGELRSDISARELTSVFQQAVLGSALFNSLASNKTDDAASVASAFWEFCRVGLVGPPQQPDVA